MDTEVYLGSSKYHRRAAHGSLTVCGLGSWRLQPTDKVWLELSQDERCKRCGG